MTPPPNPEAGGRGEVPVEVRHTLGKADNDGLACCVNCPTFVWMQYADEVLEIEVCPARDRRRSRGEWPGVDRRKNG